MMAEIVNLRQARKRKARTAAESEASQNRISFGLSKQERGLAKAERERAARTLDGARKDDTKSKLDDV
jgi:hypothetical protein